MRFSVVALLATASAVSAQTINSASLYGVLATALPSSLIQEALTNSAAVASQISSQFAAGQTPSWFQALPTDVKSYLLAQATASATASMGSMSMSMSRTSASTAMMTGTTTSRMNGTSTASVAQQTKNAAPTAFVGSGLAFGAGVVALLAL